jgi:hypothetical protein
LGSNGRVRVCFSDGGFRRNRRLHPKAALSRFPSVHRADFERQQRVDTCLLCASSGIAGPRVDATQSSTATETIEVPELVGQRQLACRVIEVIADHSQCVHDKH